MNYNKLIEFFKKINVYFVFVMIVLVAMMLIQANYNQKRLEEERKQNEIENIRASRERLQEELRKEDFRACVDESDVAYWDLVKLNGTKNADGSYRASQYVWDQAQKRKDNLIEECKLMYGK